MTARARVKQMMEYGTRILLTPDFTPVSTRSDVWKPYKPLLAYSLVRTRLKQGADEK
jgi:hypothetical protein